MGLPGFRAILFGPAATCYPAGASLAHHTASRGLLLSGASTP
jgi:hypothetical protein